MPTIVLKVRYFFCFPEYKTYERQLNGLHAFSTRGSSNEAGYIKMLLLGLISFHLLLLIEDLVLSPYNDLFSKFQISFSLGRIIDKILVLF